jgi:hypothetical protein
MAEINVDLAQSIPMALIAEKYSVTKSAIFRHQANHLHTASSAALMIRGSAEELINQGITTNETVILSLLAQTVATAQSIMNNAVASDKPIVALNALKEVRNSLALIQKFTSNNDQALLDEAIEADFKALTLALRRVLPDHREAARDLARELRMQGAVALAVTIENRILLIEDAEVSEQ